MRSRNKGGGNHTKSVVHRCLVGQGEFDAPQYGFLPGLSNLVPGKQPDWRFMVSNINGERRSHRKWRDGAPLPGRNLRCYDQALQNTEDGDVKPSQSTHIARRA